MDWELTGNTQSLKSIFKAAENLASRYDERVGAVRSWDKMINKKESITDTKKNFLVIIDSMCNLDLLFYAGDHTSNQKLIDIATSHAHFVLRSIVREDYSTFHLVNVDPRDGAIKCQRTHQGYSDSSCWSRGQAWAILGFTQAYIWTKDLIFLRAAINISDYFLARLSSTTHTHPFVPVWDFDAPPETPPLRDTSAGMIAANGLALLHQILNNDSKYMANALRIAKETIDLSLSSDKAKLSLGDDGELEVESGTWDGILMNATANNNENAVVMYSNHGLLVYADYYFLEFGNKLMRMGLI
ncbi:Unsaturated glucuronyl hydrolase [Hyphodiscus hymeniophilus]|uniref:Unsaturated glucuronyl hydrolase n=1 Tax=Hyphodiscus hymeniophilus TaxID=353542 RepID=A0A9P6VIE1_9HELO|nr:Unsaturated glucuronyl hydrolase [Hyphodiscus hymeniophilus]